MSYKETFTFGDTFSIKETVNGKDIRFFPVRHNSLGDLARISKPMLIALSALFVEAGREETAISESMKDTDGTEISKTTIEAISPELAAHKAKERRDSIEGLVECIADVNNRIMLGRLLMDSMRDEFPSKKDRPPKEVLEFLEGDGKDYDGIDLPTLTALIGGFIKANARSFGPKGEELVGAMRAKLSVLRENSPSQTQTEAAPTSGDSKSKTASSSPQAAGSQ